MPRAEYSRRVGELSARRSSLQSRERLAGYSQLALAAFGLIWILFRLRHFTAADLLLLIPVTAFIVLDVVHRRLIRRVNVCSRAIRFYEQGLARLDGHWAGGGVTGERFLEPSHPYARDLDLFGRASLFELLCTARTRAGEETLARWLLAPAPPDQVRARQAAAVELSSRLGFRENLATLGEEVSLGVRPAQLVAWGESKAAFPAGMIRIVLPMLAVLWILSVAAWQLWGASELLVLATTVVNLGITYRFRRTLNDAAHVAEEAGHDLNLLSQVLKAFELEPFTSPMLLALQARLKPQGTPPSRAIGKLNRLVESLESAHNLFVRPFDPVIFYRLQFVLSIESWRRRYGSSLRVWIETVGELEALAALGGYTYEHHEDVFPEFVDRAPCFEAKGLAHPLIPLDRAVANDLQLNHDLQLMIVSGPNMAGKSTFLRGIGVNAVLAQSGAPVRAVSLQLSPLAVTASICVLDSLEGGISRFYAEINRLKQIMDLTSGPRSVLFLLDELLSGTNSHDRLIGTRSFVTKLVERGAVGLVSTHDLALTAIPKELGPQAINCHFEDHLEEGKLRFDYKLYPGIVQTSNALSLMRSIGLEI
ncbi:MAG TPA: mismatch repair protein [Acidobacteriaceae bacterium]|nr:mismatch repair protein [Acidobacteriaceae bacterium]